jgi:hypothetical protein
MRLLRCAVCLLAVLGAGCGPVTVKVAQDEGLDREAGAQELDRLLQLAHDIQGVWVGSVMGAPVAITWEFITDPGTLHGRFVTDCAVPDGSDCKNNPIAQIVRATGKFAFTELTETGATLQITPTDTADAGSSPFAISFSDVHFVESDGGTVLGFATVNPIDGSTEMFAFRRVGARGAGT